MRILGALGVVATLFALPALAMDDCNQFGSVGQQLQQRLECLQKNNNELLDEINKLKESGLLKYGSQVYLQSQAGCLHGSSSAGHAVVCGSPDTKITLTPPQ